MASGTRAGLRNKNDDGQSSRNRLDTREVMSNTSTRAATASGSKQSGKSASSGQSPPSIRKSERLEKRTPPTTLITRKSERLVKDSNPSPLRRSGRGKKHHSSSPSGSNHSGKSFSSVEDAYRRKEKKEKSVQQLTMKSQGVVMTEKYDQGSISSKRRRMDARSYKSLFKSQKRSCSRSDSDEKYEIQDTLPQIDNVDNGGSDSKLAVNLEDGPKCDQVVIEHARELLGGASEAAPSVSLSSFEDIDASISGNDGEANFLLSNREHYLSEKPPDHLDGVDGNISMTGRASLDDASKRLKDDSGAESLNVPKLVDSVNMQRSTGSGTCSESTVHSGKLKSTAGNLEKDGISGSCVVCHKKQRLAYNSPEEELCSCTAAEKDTWDVELAFNPECAEQHDRVSGLDETLTDIQTLRDRNICMKCKLPGELLYCHGRGCRKCYHPSCLDPILNGALPGVWHCSYCTKKKIEFGVYMVTKGVESIWDAREVVVSDTKEKQKQYLVKYQGLAHFYNHWILESRLLLETPSLVAKYNENNQTIVWNLEWTVPSRLLRRRPLASLEPEDKCNEMGTDNISDRHYEWLVKWCGLDYMHATWELENANFLQSTEGQKLIQEYENRCEKAKCVNYKSAKGSTLKLKDLLSAGGSTLSDDCYLQNVNKLRELWTKNQNAVVFDEQDRFANVILFILSLSNDHHQPFLVTSTSEALSQWEAEFMRLAPSIDVVVYKGNIDNRRSIRALEFHEEFKGGLMLQVLLSPVEVVFEDIQFLKRLKWKVVVVDECQRASPDMKQLNLLDSDMRLLLFSGQLKDTVAEYSSLILLLGSSDDLNTIDNLAKLKEFLSRFTAYSKFVEYLVPVEISNLQLELYCATLLANATALRSNWKTDHVGAFREILMTLRKCCDHPYMVDSSLQPSLVEGLTPDQLLEVGIKASGKLQTLHEILAKIRNQRLRALVLFQSMTGSGGITIGDILDDFMRQKFGQNSYERIDACLNLNSSKKQAALNRFNNIGGEQFVFLLENRACHPSIKLLVDVVVIFDSEWNPANDLKSLYRLYIRSQSEQINVFRLYSCFTIEEKVLILGKQNLNLENSLQTIKYSTSLLMWGASTLFSRLDEYHAGNSSNSAADISSGGKLLFDVMSDLSAMQSGFSKENDKYEKVISKVFRNAGTYNTNCPVLGERKVKLMDLEEPHIYWKRLLEGKNPRWKFSIGSSPRSRKRVQYAEESKQSDLENGDSGRKRKKGVNISSGAASVQLEQEESQIAGSNRDDSCMADLQVISPSNEQKNLHAFVKAQMVKLCEILKLSEEVKQMIDRFLEYVMENHHVNKEPASILQAFQLSLCWIAASILKHKIDKKSSLELAKQILDFKCTEEEASSVYLKLRLLKKTFLQLPGNTSSSNAGERPSRSSNLQNVKAEVEERWSNQELAQIKSKDNLTGNDFEKRIKKIQKKCDKRISKLHQNHEREIEEFHKMWATKKKKLEADHQAEVTFVWAIHGNSPLGTSKLKMSDAQFAKKMAEHEHLKEVQLKELEAKHSTETEEEREKISNWLAEAKSCSNRCRIVNEVHMHGSESEDDIAVSNTAFIRKRTENDASPSGLNIEEQGPVRAVHAAQARDAISSHLPVTSGVEAVSCSILDETFPILLNSNPERESETGEVEESFIPRVEQHEEGCHSFWGIQDIPSVDRTISEKHDTGEVPLTGQSNKMPLQEPGNTGCETGYEHAVGMSITLDVSTSKEQSAYEIPLTSNEMVPRLSGSAGLEMEHDHAIAMNSPVESNAGNDEENIAIPNVTRNQKDQVEGSSCEDVISQELLAAELRDPLPSAVECLKNKESFAVQDEHATRTGTTTTVEVVGLAPFDAGIKTRSNIIENSKQLEQVPEDIATGSSRSPATEAVCQDLSERSNCLQIPVASTQFREEPAEVLPEPVSEDAANAVLHPPVGPSDSAQVQNPPDLQRDNRAGYEPNNELSAHSQDGEAQVTPNAAELPNQAGSQLGPNLAIPEPSHLQLHGARRVASWNPSTPVPVDPLQNEFERIQIEIDQATKLHDSTVEQIRKEYEAKLKDAQTAFVLKKTELEANKNKVLMNKILAEAFRSKCMDLKSSGISGVQQVVPFSFMQHLHELSLRQRHSPVVSQHAVNPSVQCAQHSSGSSSGLPARPPLINAITPAIVNARISGEVRAPAPHLQPFRPPGCIFSANMSALPYNSSQQVAVNAPVTSPSPSRFPLPQQALVTSSRFSLVNPPASLPSAVVNHSGSNQISESEGGVQPYPHNTALSALELLRNVHNQPSGHAPNILPSSPHCASNASGTDLASQDYHEVHGVWNVLGSKLVIAFIRGTGVFTSRYLVSCKSCVAQEIRKRRQSQLGMRMCIYFSSYPVRLDSVLCTLLIREVKLSVGLTLMTMPVIVSPTTVRQWGQKKN